MSTPVCKKPSGFTLQLIREALGDISHRFILIIECENRKYIEPSSKTPPRFAIGGSFASVDPRDILISELTPLDESHIKIPSGCEMAHEFIQVVYNCTDEHGWQYRTCWPDRPLREADELWSKSISSSTHVRWRLWMTTVVKQIDVLDAKKKICEMTISHQKGVIIESLLLRLEQNVDGEKVWVSRRVALLDGKIEIFDIETGTRLNEYDLLKFEIKMMDGFAFSLRCLDGSSCVLLDADCKETKRQWLASINYQATVRVPMIGFTPFPYAPPLGNSENRAVLCGKLLKKDAGFFSWNNVLFRLTPTELQYLVLGKKKILELESAKVKTEENNLRISFISKSGHTVIVKAIDAEHRNIWVTAFRSQVTALADKEKSLTFKIPAETRALSVYNSDILTVIPSVAVLNANWLNQAELDANTSKQDEKIVVNKDCEDVMEKAVEIKEMKMSQTCDKPRDLNKIAQDLDSNTDSETDIDNRVLSAIIKAPREETKEEAALPCV